MYGVVSFVLVVAAFLVVVAYILVVVSCIPLVVVCILVVVAVVLVVVAGFLVVAVHHQGQVQVGYRQHDLKMGRTEKIILIIIRKYY